MTVFRPCIDLHQGVVKQIVGGTLTDGGALENFVSEDSAAHFAALYAKDALRGGHVIMLGSGNESAAKEALGAYPKGLHVGGGVTDENARQWLDAGASHVIVTSYLFEENELSMRRLSQLLEVVQPSELVIDLSCRKTKDGYFVATNRWQTITEARVDARLLGELAEHCSEFLVHAADVEGLCQGIEEDLVKLLGDASPVPCTYAGGARDLSDLGTVARLSGGRVDLTFGSALDIFGGSGVKYRDLVAYNRKSSDPLP